MTRSTLPSTTRFLPIIWLVAILVTNSLFATCRWSEARGAQRVEALSCDDLGTQASYVYLSKESYYSCDLAVPFPVETIDVVLSTTGATSVTLTIPDPPVGTIIGESWLFPATGDRLNGVRFDLEACEQTPRLILGTLTVFFGDSAAGCHDWQIIDAEIEDCSGARQLPVVSMQTLQGPGGCTTHCCWQCCVLLPPFPLSPADGATDVPLDASLDWSGADMVQLTISSEPDCGAPETFTFAGTNSFTPDFLEPNTTYHWQVSCDYDATGSGCSNAFGVYRSPVISFTTGRRTALRPQSWDAVKRRYR